MGTLCQVFEWKNYVPLAWVAVYLLNDTNLNRSNCRVFNYAVSGVPLVRADSRFWEEFINMQPAICSRRTDGVVWGLRIPLSLKGIGLSNLRTRWTRSELADYGDH